MRIRDVIDVGHSPCTQEVLPALSVCPSFQNHQLLTSHRLPLSTGSSPPPSPTAQTQPQVSALRTDKPLDPQLPPMPLPCSFCPHHLSTFTVTLFSSQPQALRPHFIPPWQDPPPGCVIFSYLASLCPSFLIGKMGLMVVPTP
ncbi:unnamed protein product [Rangifer tarandus platyrhynchus]|uniref:Uncharacterized protein n=1 Tax=Rangifer tarandus platyrhynchus TaxID=3082113 RepID=A0ABN8YZ79_RANTA|nr:unnamed protein product [Rangifer tarandus platyrhynchus]